MKKTLRPGTPAKIKTINPEAKTPGKVELLCIRNTFLPDGTFVGKDTRIWVDSGFARAVAAEKNPSFTILN